MQQINGEVTQVLSYDEKTEFTIGNETTMFFTNDYDLIIVKKGRGKLDRFDIPVVNQLAYAALFPLGVYSAAFRKWMNPPLDVVLVEKPHDIEEGDRVALSALDCAVTNEVDMETGTLFKTSSELVEFNA